MITMMTILEHNALFRSDMSIAETIEWVDAHTALLEQYDQISCEEVGGGIKSEDANPIVTTAKLS